MNEECVFCTLTRDMDKVTYHQNRIVSFEPLNPVTPGHRLFVSQIHTRDARDLPYLTGGVFAIASIYAKEQGLPFNLITSGGAEATQSVYHLHVHYVPRAADDGLTLPWSSQHAIRKEKEEAGTDT